MKLSHFIFYFPLGALTPVTLLSCAEVIAESREATVAEPHGKLSDPQVTVCWHKKGQKFSGSFSPQISSFMEFSEQQKAWIRDILSQEFSRTRTGVFFTGFETCPENPALLKKMVRIARGVAFVATNQSATIGQTTTQFVPDDLAKMVYAQDDFEFSNTQVPSVVNPPGSSDPVDVADDPQLEMPVEQIANGSGMKPQTMIFSNIYGSVEQVRNENIEKAVLMQFDSMCQDKTVSVIREEACVKLITLHEFGHVAGLRHEHIRPEAKNDPNCKNRLQPNGRVTNETLSATSQSFGLPYDPTSVMNYCYGFQFLSDKTKKVADVKLSDLDIKTLQKVYQK